MAEGKLLLSSWKFRGTLDSGVVRLYTLEILHCLKFLHGFGIMYCDLKCKNVLLKPNGNVKWSISELQKDWRTWKEIGTWQHFPGNLLQELFCGWPRRFWEMKDWILLNIFDPWGTLLLIWRQGGLYGVTKFWIYWIYWQLLAAMRSLGFLDTSQKRA